METILTVLLAIAFLAVLYLGLLDILSRRKASKIEAELRLEKEKHASETKQLTDHASRLETENKRLAKWEGVADADAKATEILQEAERALAKAKADAEGITADSYREADNRLTTARDIWQAR